MSIFSEIYGSEEDVRAIRRATEQKSVDELDYEEIMQSLYSKDCYWEQLLKF